MVALGIDPIPLCLWRHEESYTGLGEGGGDGGDGRHGDLEVDSAAQWCVERSSYPVPADAELFEHHVRGPEFDVGEPFRWARVANGEPTKSTPEVQALIEIYNEKLGDERWTGVLRHVLIVAGIGLESDRWRCFQLKWRR